MSPPKNDAKWSDEAESQYERIRPLGSGGFGTVWMARDKKSSTFVAAKNVGIGDPKARSYAAREISIMSQISHPHIVKLVQSFPHEDGADTFLVVMSLANGPSLATLIDKGGAIGLPAARLLSRELVSAVSYLHARAVIHRDLKPNNIIVEGAFDENDKNGSKLDESIWSDGDDAVKKVKEGKWKLILVDFGFAKALTKKDLMLKTDLADILTEENQSMTSAMSSRSSGQSSKRLSAFSFMTGSFKDSKEPNRSSIVEIPMSAVGTRQYVAPEVILTMRDDTSDQVIAQCVSDYTMNVDAYSLGSVILEMMTGVPAGTTPSEFLMEQNFCNNILCRCLLRRRKLIIRMPANLPREVKLLIKGLTCFDPSERMTVRQAQEEAWIKGGKGEEEYISPQGDVPYRKSDKIVFLTLDDDKGKFLENEVLHENSDEDDSTH